MSNVLRLGQRVRSRDLIAVHMRPREIEMRNIVGEIVYLNSAVGIKADGLPFPVRLSYDDVVACGDEALR